jgi:hypothetical protein
LPGSISFCSSSALLERQSDYLVKGNVGRIFFLSRTRWWIVRAEFVGLRLQGAA